MFYFFIAYTSLRIVTAICHKVLKEMAIPDYTKFCTNLLSIIFFHITNLFVFTIAAIAFNNRLIKILKKQLNLLTRYIYITYILLRK